MQKVILLLNQENFNLKPFPCRLAEDWSKENNTFHKQNVWFVEKSGQTDSVLEMKHSKITDP